MIEYLRIRNLALIADAELDFAPGMNVLSGETGAGKSFILKAINFILGEKLSADLVRPGEERAQVEALFSLPGEDLILRRELLAESGRSRFYINDNLSSQETVRALREQLVTHTSQHGQQRLLQPAYQGELVDRWMDAPDLLQRKDAQVAVVRDLLQRKQALQERSQKLSERRELLELHLKDIEKVNPQPGEEEELEQKRQRLRSVDKLKQHYEKAMLALRGEDGPGLMDLLAALEREVDALAELDSALTPYQEPLYSLRETITELERHLRQAARSAAPLPGGNSDAIEARLYALAQLKRKLHRTLPEILSMRQEIEENLSFLDVCGLDLIRLEKEEAQALNELRVILEECNAARRVAADAFCSALEEELKGLGFSEHVRVLPQFLPHELFGSANFASGTVAVGTVADGNDEAALPCVEDRVRLLWAPNPGQHPQPLDRIASGGELSRFLLAVVSVQMALQAGHAEEAATLIFDEVDAGVGGLTLNRVAERLNELAEKRQMLLITHWPQLASRAVRHFQVSKSIESHETFTRCKRLNDSERSEELARMAGIENQA